MTIICGYWSEGGILIKTANKAIISNNNGEPYKYGTGTTSEYGHVQMSRGDVLELYFDPNQSAQGIYYLLNHKYKNNEFRTDKR